MQILITDLNQIFQPFSSSVLTIGNFDGIHLGHQGLFQKVRERARAIQGTSVVVTFNPHPAQILRPSKAPRQIVADENKARLIFQHGIEVVLSLPFSKEFAQLPAKSFIREVLLDTIGMKEIVIGYDYTFGRKREGNIHLLKEFGDLWDFRVHVHPPVTIRGQLVSSTRIRELVARQRSKVCAPAGNSRLTPPWGGLLIFATGVDRWINTPRWRRSSAKRSQKA